MFGVDCPVWERINQRTHENKQVFGDIMIDYSYVELTSACLTAMRKFATRFPQHRRGEVERAIAKGARFIKAVRVACVCERV